MQGEHQLANASVAIMALLSLHDKENYQIHDFALLQGLEQTSWIGRFEQLSASPLLVVDGAHNEEGMKALAQTLQTHYPEKKYKILLAVTKEKDIGQLLQPFQQLRAEFTFTSFFCFSEQPILLRFTKKRSSQICESTRTGAVL